MIGMLVALGAALAPGNAMKQVSISQLSHSRNVWLLGVAVCGIGWLFTVEPWLAVMALWHVLRWNSVTYHESAWTWLARGWVALAVWHVRLRVRQQFRGLNGYERPSLLKRGVGWLGSPPRTAIFLALALPFAPWWLYPVFAVGFYIIFSWLSFAC